MKMKAEPFAKAVRDVELIFNDLEAQKNVSAQWSISPVFLFPRKSVWKISGKKKDCMMKLQSFCSKS